MINETFRLQTIQDIADVATPENIDNLLKDLKGVLLGYMAVRIVSPTLKLPHLDWIDDGDNTVYLEFEPKKD